MNRFQLWAEQKRIQISNQSHREAKLKLLELFSKEVNLNSPNNRYLAKCEHLADTAITSIDLVDLTAEQMWQHLEQREKKRSAYRLSIEAYADPNTKYECNFPAHCDQTVYGYQIPLRENIEALKSLAGQDLVLEVGAGRALWAKLLAANGVNIVCVDNLSWFCNSVAPFYPVEELDWIEAVKKYSNANVLLTIWPPYESPSLNTAIVEFKGNYVVFVGEFGGCCGGEELYLYLSNHWNVIAEHKCLKGTVDAQMYIFCRK